MFCKSSVLIDRKDENLFVKIEESYLKWDWVNNRRDDIRFIWLIDSFGLRRLARSDRNDLWNWEFENDCSCRRSRSVSFNSIDSAYNDWKVFNEIIIKKNICLRIFYQFHISDHQINSAKILSSRRRKIRISLAVNTFKVVQDVSSSRLNVSIHLFFTFKYCQLQSFHDLFEIDRIFLDELDGLVRNMMISDFEHQLIHRFIWSSSFHKFYAFLDSFLTLFRIDN